MKNCWVLLRTFTQMTGKMLLRFTVRNQQCWRWRVCLVSKRKPVWEISYKSWSSLLKCIFKNTALPSAMTPQENQPNMVVGFYLLWCMGFFSKYILWVSSYWTLFVCLFVLFPHTRKKYFPQPRFPNQAVLCLICTQGVTTVLYGAVLPWAAGGAQGGTLLSAAKAWSHPTLQRPSLCVVADINECTFTSCWLLHFCVFNFTNTRR